MKKIALLLALTLAITAFYRVNQLLAQSQINPPVTTSKVTPDDAKTKTVTTAKKDDAGAKTTYLSPDKGIGPITELKLGQIDTSLVAKGKTFFQGQCVACHQLDKKLIGPPLRNVSNERPPEFIMNMLLNTVEMQKKDPEVKKLIGQYGTLMSALVIKQDQARQLLEYLRWAATQPPVK
jgi:cytochrome c